MGSWLDRNVFEPGKGPTLLCFAAFVVTFLVTRTITRLIRAGRGPFRNNISGGVHIHHAVPGIILLITGGFGAVAISARSPWMYLAALAVGVGTSLVLDEFALILHLQDVYWSDEGRISVEMISLAFGCMGFVLVGIAPFGVDDVGDAELGLRVSGIAALMVTVAVLLVCVLKGKARLALLGAFVPVLAWVGAVRLARPRSRWARRYDPQKLAHATRRAARFDRRWAPLADRLSDLIAGRPSEPDPPATGTAPAAGSHGDA